MGVEFIRDPHSPIEQWEIHEKETEKLGTITKIGAKYQFESDEGVYYYEDLFEIAEFMKMMETKDEDDE